MGAFKKGSVVLIRFPFSDLSSQKLRPAVVIAKVDQEDFILCQVTSRPYDSRAIALTGSHFAEGSLHRVSYARPGKLFTACGSILLKEIGVLETAAVGRLIDAIVEVIRDEGAR